MNRNLIAFLLVLLALAGCGTARSISQGVPTATSSTVHQAVVTGIQLAGKCVGSNPTSAQLITIAASKISRDALVTCLSIPPANRRAFGHAVAVSALAWEQAGGFKTRAGRYAWALGDTTLMNAGGVKIPTLPELIGEFR